MTSTAQVLRELFAEVRPARDAAGLIEHAADKLAALPTVTRVAILIHQKEAPLRVRSSAARGLSTEALAGIAALTTVPQELRVHTVPLAGTAEQVSVACDGSVDPQTLWLVATFLGLALERDQAVGETLRLSELFSEGPVVVFRWRSSAGWPVEFVSSNVTRVLGYSRAQVVEHPYASLVHPNDLERVATEVEEAMARGVSYFTQQYRVFDAQGQVHDVFDFTHLVRDAKGVVTHFHGYLFDDGPQARAERGKAEATQQSQKLQAEGALASGIAHDFNNVLAAVLAHLELARLEPARTDNADLVAAMQAAMRGRDIVRQLLVFGRARPEERLPHRLQRIIEDSMGVMRSTIPSSIGLRLSLDPKAPAVLADAVQLQQVLVNLVTLAAHALPQAGTVDITVTTRVGTPGGAELTVTSEGEGLPAQRSERGLGLSVVRTIIKAHGGTIDLKAHSAMVFFPAVNRSEPLGPDGLEPSPGTQGRIALVDDEPLVARATERLISQFGYQVTTFSSADEVLGAFAARPDAFALVLTDQTMPEMTGLELTRSLRAKGLHVPVLLVTGLPTEIEVESVAPPFAVLGKPYRSEELATALADLLHQRSP